MQIYHVCDLGNISESVRGKLERYIQNGDDSDKRQFLSLRKASEMFPSACPVTDRRFNVSFIGLNMHFGV